MLKKINITVPLNNLGFGIFSMSYLKILIENTTLDISLFNIASDTGSIEGLCTDFDLSSHHVEDLLAKPAHVDTCNLIVWHPGLIKDYLLPGKNIGFTHFETTQFKPNEVNSMKVDNLDKILVTNNWAFSILELQGIKSDIVPGPALPLYLDTKESDLSMNFCEEDETLFLSSGKWEVRKGHYILVEAFSKLKEKATLIGLWDNVFLNSTIPALSCIRNNGFIFKTYIKLATNVLCYIYENSIGNKIIAVSRLPKFSDIIYFYKNVDCYVNCSAGEGWNLPLVEAMSMGVPVISTNNTAQAMYINPDNSFMIHTNKSELAKDGIWFKGNVGHWYPANVQDILRNLTEVCKLKKSSPQVLLSVGHKGQSTIEQLCSPDNIIKQLLSALQYEL